MEKVEFKFKSGPTTYYWLMNAKTYEDFKKACDKFKK